MRQRFSETGKCLITWNDDGSLSKELVSDAGDLRERFRHEIAVNEMLLADGPPLSFARLLGSDGSRSMRFEVLDGEPLGPKWGAQLDDSTVLDLLQIADAVAAYAPSADWLPTYAPLEHPLLQADERAVPDERRNSLRAVIDSCEWSYSFAHGDFIPRNVLSTPEGLSLIDWEFAGRYPVGFDHAFLWLVLRETPGARALIESRIDQDALASFLLCACTIQLVHIGMAYRRDRAFLADHWRDYERMFDRLLSSVTPSAVSANRKTAT